MYKWSRLKSNIGVQVTLSAHVPNDGYYTVFAIERVTPFHSEETIISIDPDEVESLVKFLLEKNPELRLSLVKEDNNVS